MTDAAGAALLDGLDTGVPADARPPGGRPGIRRTGGRPRRHPRRLGRGPVPTAGGRSVPAAVHLGHHRRAQGGPLHPGPPGLDRPPVGRGLRVRARRRGLLRHAPLPRQRPHGPVGADPGGRGDGGPRPSVQRVGLPARTCAATGSPPSPTSARRSPTCWPRRPLPTTPTAPCAAASAPRRRWRTTPRSRTGSAASSPRGTARARGGWPSTVCPGTPTGSLGLPSEDVVVVDPVTGRECPPAEFDTAGSPPQRLRGGRGDRQPLRVRSLRGLLQRPRGHRAAPAERVVLDRRPGVPRRRRLVLVRRAVAGTGCGSTPRT